MYKIILADDEATMRRALLTLVDWKAMDCGVVYAAEDGQAVLDYLSICKPDIVISDIRMPRVDGLQLAEYLAKREPQIKMILLTAFAEFQYAQQAIRWNVSEYVVKSGALDSIVAAVERCKEQLEKTGKERENRTKDLAHFFKAIAEGTLYQEKEILLRGDSLGIDKRERIVLLQRLPAAEFPEEHVRLELLNRAARLLTDMLGNGVETVFPMEAGLCCFVTAGMEQEELECRCRQAQASFARLTGAAFYLGISTCGTDLLRLPEGVRQCREALDYCFYFPQCAISTYSASRFSSDGAAFFSAQNVRLADTLRLGAIDPSRELLEGIFSFPKKNLLRPDEVR